MNTLALLIAVVIPLWPVDKMPYTQSHQIAAMTDAVAQPGFKADEHRMPFIDWLDAPATNVKNGAIMILISGGSYRNCCDVGLIKSWNRNLTERGYQCVNFVYRTPRPNGLPIYQSAWADGQRAVRLVRAEARKRGYDPNRIGAISMSAGSHLNTLLATSSLTPAYEKVDALDDEPCNLNLAVACATAFATTDANVLGTPATRGGNAVDVTLDPAFKFDAATCPMCLTHGGVDIYSPNGSTLIYRELRKRNVLAELHLVADAGHGAHCFDEALEFMRQLNFDKKLEPEIDILARDFGSCTARRVKVALWPDGKMPDVQTNQTYAPYLEWFLPRNPSTRAIQIVFPGGGYRQCTMDREGEVIAKYFNQRGMTAVVVKYRTPRPVTGLAKHTSAWQDAQRAIRLVKHQARSYDLDANRVGVMGFSAGGHLTLMCATSARSMSYRAVDAIDQASCKVAWACPIYPAYALSLDNRPSDAVLSDAGNGDASTLVPEFAFDLDTPPMCFVHGDADTVSAMHSVKTWEKLRRMGIQGDLHTLATRRHVFYFKASPGTGSWTWLNKVWTFLSRKRLNGKDVTYLWPRGQMPDEQADQIAAPSEETRSPIFKRAEHRRPYLEWSLAPEPSKKNGACVILISGGGYNCTCDQAAFKPLEKKLIDNGVTCVWLWYRTPRPKGLPIYQTAWEDGQRAVRLVRAQAAVRGIDPHRIGVLGCSAGSHLSLLLATSSLTSAYAPVDANDVLSCSVDFALPMCPAYVLDDGLEDKNARGGAGAKISSVFAFDRATPPMCLFHGENDPYSPLGSTQVYRQLRRMKLPAEVHLDADRAHGPVSAEAFERALEFMRQLGLLGPLAAEVPAMERFASDDACATCEKEWVWPEGKMPDVQTNQTYAPYIEWHLPKVLKTKAIQIVYSGGSYLSSGVAGFEVVPARRYLNEKGMTVVTLKYRAPRPVTGLKKHVTAWQDLQRTIRLVRHGAAVRGLDANRIGIMGSSAGGHMTLLGATSSQTNAYAPIDALDELSCAANWAIAIYPAYALTDGAEKPNAGGGNGDEAVLVPEFAFDCATCPTLFVHGDADGWAAMNSVKAWEKLRTMGLSAEVHTLALRKHCFQKAASPATGSYTWLDRIWEFMTKKGFNQ